jgi:hypothetical protein
LKAYACGELIEPYLSQNLALSFDKLRINLAHGLNFYGELVELYGEFIEPF